MMREVPCSGPQAGQGPTIADNGDRAAGKVSDGGILEVDAQMTVNGGQQIAGCRRFSTTSSPLRSVAPRTCPVWMPPPEISREPVRGQ